MACSDVMTFFPSISKPGKVRAYDPVAKTTFLPV